MWHYFISYFYITLAKRRALPGYARNRSFGLSGKFVLSRFHGRFSIQLTIAVQYSLHQMFRNIWRENRTTFPWGQFLCSIIKTSGFYPDSGFFRIFFKSPCSLDHSVQLLLNKVCHILIPQRGDRASMRYVVTHTTLGIYILILVWRYSIRES